IDLVVHLAVGLVEPVAQPRHDMAVREGTARNPVFGDLTAPGVTPPAHLDLFAQARRRGTSLGRIVCRIMAPAYAGTLSETCEQPFRRVVRCAGQAVLLSLRPSNMG